MHTSYILKNSFTYCIALCQKLRRVSIARAHIIQIAEEHERKHSLLHIAVVLYAVIGQLHADKCDYHIICR